MKKSIKLPLITALTGFAMAISACQIMPARNNNDSSTIEESINNPATLESSQPINVSTHTSMPIQEYDGPIYKGMFITRNETKPKSNKRNDTYYGHEGHDEEGDSLDKDISEIVIFPTGKTNQETEFFVETNEVFLLNICFNNPKSYVIQSLTLNGVKYANYMFERESTMEILMLQVTAPAEPGYFKYTISDIQYADSTGIKEVDMSQGDETIKIGAGYSNIPSATITKEVGTTKVVFEITINDPHGLIGDNELAVYLSDGKNALHTSTLVVGTQVIEFTNLEMSKLYQVGVAAVFDNLDGRNLHQEWLCKETFLTNAGINIHDIVAGKTSIDFQVDTLDSAAIITSIKLYDKNTQTAVDQIGPNDRKFENVLSDHDYVIIIDYKYTITDGTKSDWVSAENIHTDAKTVPTINFGECTSDKNSIAFNTIVDDPDNVLSETKVELVKGSNIISTSLNTLSGSFEQLLSNNDYTLKLSYSYDLNNGNGAVTGQITKNIRTKAMVVPTVTISNCTKDKTSISYSISTSDEDNVLTINGVKLLKGEQVVQENSSDLSGSFAGLLSNNSYTVEVDYSYDLCDGLGVVNKTVSKAVITDAKEEGQVKIARKTEPLNGNQTLQYSLEGNGSYYRLSGFGTCRDKSLVLGGYYNNLPIKVLGSQSLIGCGWIEEAVILDTVTDIGYEVFYGTSIKKVIFQGTTPASFDYNIFGYQSPEVYVPDEAYDTYANISNSLWLQDIVDKGHLHPISDLGVRADELFYGEYDGEITQTSIQMKYDVVDNDGTCTLEKAQLYRGEEVVQTINNPSNVVKFENLLSGIKYRLVLSYELDLNDGNAPVKQTIETDVKTDSKKVPSIDAFDVLMKRHKDEFTFDELGQITGLKENHGDILYIDAPIANEAFRNNNTFSTVVIGPHCTRIGAAAFYCEDARLKSVVILNNIMPEMGNDTFGFVWNYDDFRVYVPDENYEAMRMQNTGDDYWNGYKESRTHKYSEMPESLLTLTTLSSCSAGQDCINYLFDKEDPDNILVITSVDLYKGEQLISSITDGALSGKFENLQTDTSYVIKLNYQYDLNDGNGPVTEIVEIDVKTLAKQAPSFAGAVNALFNEHKEDLLFNEYGDVNGVSENFPTIVYIDTNVCDYGMYNKPNITTVILGPNCTSLGDCAFGYTTTITTVILCGDVLPSMVYDTFCLIWDDNFRVYVPDEAYESIVNTQSNDGLWNSYVENKGIVGKHSEIQSLIRELGLLNTAIATNNSIDYEFLLSDPDNLCTIKSVELLKGDEVVATGEAALKGVFTGLDADTSYTIRLSYEYDLGDGNGVIQGQVVLHATTLA